MVALQAGCVQQPPAGTLIGMDNIVFTTKQVNIMWPGYNPNDPQENKKKKGIPQAAIIGISVGLVALLMIALVVFFFVRRQIAARRKQNALKSPLDVRFGAANITSPNPGAYGN